MRLRGCDFYCALTRVFPGGARKRSTTFRANRPLDLPKPRPDYVRSTNRVPMQAVEDAATVAMNVPITIHQLA